MVEPGAPGISVILVTVPDKDTGRTLARHLVGNRLAACVNIVPGVESIYEWEGKLEQEQECMLVIKTQSERVLELTAAVREQHPYDEPEVLALPVTGGSQSYMDWVRAGTHD